MTFEASLALGVLNLERGTPENAPQSKPPIGALRNPMTFGVPIYVETVEGAWVENVVRGDPSLERPYVEAARRLVARGATVISSTCGFSVRHQLAVASAVDVPVAMSSLLILPSLLRQIPPNRKIAVLTYDSTHISDDLLGLEKPEDRERVVIGGIEGGKFWRDELLRPAPPIDYPAIENDVSACVSRLRLEGNTIAAILFECAAFPVVAPTIRRLTGLPVYDIVGLCRSMLESVSTSPQPSVK